MSVTIPISAIQSLPDGASYSQKKGRTRVSLKRDGNALVAAAESDSVGLVMERYERKARDNLRCSNTSVNDSVTSARKHNGVPPIIWVAVFVMMSVMGAMAVGKWH